MDVHAHAGATWLAPATHLSLPRFELSPAHKAPSGGVEVPHLALTMIDARLASAPPRGTWGDPAAALVEASLTEWTARQGWAAFAGTYEFELNVYQSGAVPGRWYLGLGCVDHTGLAYGDAVRSLAAVDHRLPALVWSRFAEALDKYVEIWDHRWALGVDPFWYENEAECGECGASVDWYHGERKCPRCGEPCEPAFDPWRAIPKCLQRPAVKEATRRRTLAGLRLHPESWAGKVVSAVDDLAAEAAGGEEDSSEIARPYASRGYDRHPFRDAGQKWPALVTFMDHGDDLTHLWDFEGDGLSNDSVHTPSAAWIIEVGRPASVRRAHDQLATAARTLAKGAVVIDLLENPVAGPQPRALASSLEPAAPRSVGRPLVHVLAGVDDGGEDAALNLQEA